MIPNSPVLQAGSPSPCDWGWSWEAKRVTHEQNSRWKTLMLNSLSSLFYHIATSPVAVEPSSTLWPWTQLTLWSFVFISARHSEIIHAFRNIYWVLAVYSTRNSRYSGQSSGQNQKKKKEKKLLTVLMELTSILEGWGPKYKIICKFYTVLAGRLCDGEKKLKAGWGEPGSIPGFYGPQNGNLSSGV